MNSSTFRGAFAALLVLALWSLAALWLNMVAASGASIQEITFLGMVTVALPVLVPLYWKQIPWSYVAGICVIVFGFSWPYIRLLKTCY